MGIKRGITPRAAEIGKLKIGRKNPKPRQGKNGQWFAPERLDHFIVVRTDRDQAKVNFLEDEQVMEALGAEPKEIPIILPFDDPELNFQTSFAFYQGRQCLCRGNGLEADMTFLKDGKPAAFTLLDTEELGDTVHKNEKRKIVCDPDTCPMMKPDATGATKCKPNGRLCCIIPASKRLNGYYFFRTTSWASVGYIMKALEDMKIQAGGILKGVPAKLFFHKRASQDHGNVPAVTIDWDFDEVQNMRDAVVKELDYRNQFQIDVKQIEQKAIESGVLEDRDDAEDVVSEFYPHQTEEAIERKNKIATGNITDRADAVLGKAEEAEIIEEPEEQEPEKPIKPEKPKDETEKSALDLF